MTYLAFYSTLLFARVYQRFAHGAWLYYLCLFAMFVFSAFRFEVGCDWPNYLLNFSVQSGQGIDFAIEQPNPAHWVLIDVIQMLGLEYPWLNVVTSAIFFTGLHAFARRSPNPLAVLVLAFPLLVLNMPMAAVKQAAAIGLVCFAFNSFNDRKLIPTFVILLAASLFHSSAAIFMLLLPFVIGGYTRKNLVIASIIGIPILLVIASSDAAELASERYIGTDREANGAIFRVLLLSGTGLFYKLFLSRQWSVTFPESHKLISLLSYGMMGLILVVPLSTVIADRLGYYFVIPQLLIFAAIPYLMRGGAMKAATIAPYVILAVVLMVWMELSSHYARCYDPYMMVF